MRQHCRDHLAQISKHLFEQDEGFTLVFVKRVFLGIGAQAHRLFHVIKGKQVFLPLLVQHLQSSDFSAIRMISGVKRTVFPPSAYPPS